MRKERPAVCTEEHAFYMAARMERRARGAVVFLHGSEPAVEKRESPPSWREDCPLVDNQTDNFKQWEMLTAEMMTRK